MRIILASQSPRRKELLERMGIRNFDTISPDVDETVEEHISPEEMVRTLSLRKARAVARRLGDDDAVIIAADTVVALEGTVLGKPKDERDAFTMLSALSGQRHQVHTGFTVLRGEVCFTGHETTEVEFRELDFEEIEHYIATGEPMDKAGAYGIQGYGALLVSGIRGDYYNVMGLPVYRLGRVLSQLGVDCMALAAGR